MADLVTNGGAAARAADVLVRGVGGREVQVRLPALSTTSATEQLGLGMPQFQDVELAPVVLLKADKNGVVRMLTSAIAVDRAAAGAGFTGDAAGGAGGGERTACGRPAGGCVLPALDGHAD